MRLLINIEQKSFKAVVGRFPSLLTWQCENQPPTEFIMCGLEEDGTLEMSVNGGLAWMWKKFVFHKDIRYLL